MPGPSEHADFFEALNELREGIALYDAQGQLVLCNRAYAGLWAEADIEIAPGLDYRDLLRQALADGCFPEARGREAAWLAERIAALGHAHRSYERQTNDGRWVRMDSRRLNSGGRISSMVDITDLKAREAEAEASREFLDRIIEAVPAPLVVKDGSDGRFLLLNRAGEELLGIPREMHLGKTGYDLFPKEQADLFAAQDREVMDSGELKIIEEEAIETPNNGVRYLRTKKIAARGPTGASVLVAVSEDITERKESREALQAALAQAEAANQAKSLFLANMSHEIRTPLNGVAAIADVLAASSLTETQRELVELIQGSARTVDHLLAEILELSSIEAGRAERVSAPFHLGDCLRERARRHAPVAEAKGLVLKLDIDPGAERWVEGDANRLQMILDALLSNAIKFTGAGQVCLAAAALDEAQFHLEVKDTGPGFDPAEAPRLFERFTQGDSSATRRHGGAGLGLAIARECAVLLDARLDVETAPGQGAAFRLDVPLAPAGDPAAASRPPAAETTGEFRALIVDDNATNRKVLELILAQVGASWMSVEDGRQAVEAWCDHRFSVVLMDIQMPVMDGLAATREIRRLEAERNQAATPVIIVSANCMPEHVAAGARAGAQEHLAKPVNAHSLIAAISHVLEPDLGEAVPEARQGADSRL
jgi:PAS domain S-box-containing protein